MKLLFASDSFKGSLTSEKTVELLGRAACEVFGACEYSGVPVADGGEGTVAAVIAATKGERVTVNVHGPLKEETESFYGIFGQDKAVIEMAAASGPLTRTMPIPPGTSPVEMAAMVSYSIAAPSKKRGFRAPLSS